MANLNSTTDQKDIANVPTNPIMTVKMKRKEILRWNEPRNYLVIVRDGVISISHKKIKVRKAGVSDLFLIPHDHTVRLEALASSRIHLIRLPEPLAYGEMNLLQRLVPYIADAKNGFLLPISMPIENVLPLCRFELLPQKFQNDPHVMGAYRHAIVHMLFLSLTESSLAILFYPLMDKSTVFLNEVKALCTKFISLKELAMKTNCSLSALHRNIRKLTGMSTYNFVRETIKDSVINELASNTPMDQVVINLQMGKSVLNRYCKEKFGMTPGKLRKQLWEKNQERVRHRKERSGKSTADPA